MKKTNWKCLLPPPVMLAVFLFAACNLIQEMPKDFVETYGNIAYVESVEYVGLAEEGGDKPKVTETKNFKIIYHIKNDGDFDLSPEFTFEGCEIKNPNVSTEKKRVSLTVDKENLKALGDGAEFKVKLTLYKATQKVLQSQYEIGMLYVYTGAPEAPTGTVEIKIPLSLPDGYTLDLKNETADFVVKKDEDGSWIVKTTGESGVAEGNYKLEFVVKDEDGNVLKDENGNEITIEKEIEVSAGKPAPGFTEKGDEKSLDEIIKEIEEKIKEIEGNANPDETKPDDGKGDETKPETPTGTVEIKIKPLLSGFTLEIKGKDKDKFEVVPNEDGSYTITTKEEGGVPEGEYELELVVKDEKTEEEIPIKEVTIEVSSESTTGGFVGEPDDKPFEITAEMIEKAKKNVVYVRGGTGATWYASNAPDAANGSDTTGDGTKEKPFATIQKAVDTVIERNAADDSASAYTIYIDGTLTQSAGGAGGMADFSTLDKNLTLTIKSPSDTKATLDANKKSRVMKARPTPTSVVLDLTLENIVIKGGETATGSGGGIDFASTGGSLTMTGCEVRDNEAKLGGGISNGGDISSDSTLTMKDCTISGNKATTNGGGIDINGGTFTVEGCTITGNTAVDSGGGIYVLKNDLEAIFTMKSGTISDNKANYGSGVYNENATFTMSGGEISSNKTSTRGGGIYINGGTVTMEKDGAIIGNSVNEKGGGVYVSDGTFEMKGGIISGNKAENSDGGGVYVFTGSTFKMEGGTIEKNEANYGGGVYVNGGTFNMSGSATTITGNKARGNATTGDGGGGGVYLYGGTFDMSGGTISGNETAGSLEYSGGGGVYVYNSGTFSMTGGTVSGNKADSGNGHGAFIQPNCTFKMSGASQFAESDDVYLYAGATLPTITVAGSLSKSEVATITLPNTAYTAGKQVLSKGGSVATITQGICDKFALSEASWKIVPDGTGSQGVLRADTNIYVRGTNAAWYASNVPTAENGNDTTGNGTKEKPFATIKKAVDTVIAQNDGTSEYTIYLDGTFTARSLAAIADFSSLSKPLSLKILGLDASNKAVLDGKNMASGISVGSGARKDVNLTLENLTVQNAKGNGIALYCEKTNSHTIKNCEIKSGSEGTGIYQVYGSLDLQDCKISGNKTNQKGGAVYSQLGSLTMTDCTVSDNSAMNGLGGGVCSDGASLTMTNCMVTKNNAKEGAGICFFYNSTDSKSLMMIKDCAINENQATSMGGGVYVYYDNFPKNITMEGCTISGNTASGDGGGVYFKLADYASSPVMKDCTVNGNNASNGKGAYLYPYMGMVKLMLDGKTKFAKDDDVYLYAAGSNVATITVADALTTESPVATITPDSYTAGRQVLSAGTGVTITQGICDKFALSETGWKIAPNGSNGVLEKDEVSTGGGGISVTLPNLGTYTFVVKSNGTQIANNGEIRADSDIILENVTDSKGAEVNGTVTIELQDTSGKILKSNDSNSKTLHVPSYPFELEAQVYVKVELENPTRVIDVTIPVTIVPNS